MQQMGMHAANRQFTLTRHLALERNIISEIYDLPRAYLHSSRA